MINFTTKYEDNIHDFKMDWISILPLGMVFYIFTSLFTVPIRILYQFDCMDKHIFIYTVRNDVKIEH